MVDRINGIHRFQQKQFMIACDMVDKEDKDLWINLIREEYEEVIVAYKDVLDQDTVETRSELTAELVDLVYVIYGLCNTMKLPFEDMFSEIHSANMRKVDSQTGKVIKNAMGKIQKPKGWKPAEKLKVFVANFPFRIF